jgi:ATP-dependent DNA helicase RecQ
LFNRLRSLRKEIADEGDVPAYVVFSDRALSEMATYYPQSSGNFLAISGVGQAKLEKYGDTFISSISAYCEEQGIEERTRPGVSLASSRTGGGRKRRSDEVGELFSGGQSILQLQQRYGVKKGTILDHLYRYHQEDHDVDASRVLEASKLTAEEQKNVMVAFADLGPEFLRPVFDALGEQVSYEELHVMRLYYLCQL